MLRSLSFNVLVRFFTMLPFVWLICDGLLTLPSELGSRPAAIVQIGPSIQNLHPTHEFLYNNNKAIQLRDRVRH